MWISNSKKENNTFYSIFKAKYIKIDLARVKRYVLQTSFLFISKVEPRRQGVKEG